jgi:N-acetylglucosamine-6-phosphate deacetylase
MAQLLLRQGALPAEFLPTLAPHQQAPRPSPGFVTADLLIDADRITGVGVDLVAPQTPTIDARGYTILPGFIDLHVHGGAGADVMDASTQGLATMAACFARHGVTAFLPTTMTAPHAPTLAAVVAVAESVATQAGGARTLGVHLEGPYISPKFPGAQPAHFIRPPNLAEFSELFAVGPIRMITLAPEVAGAEDLIRLAVRQGVVAVLGHTDATYAECVTAVTWGVTQATHTYNAMRGLHHRQPGTLGAVLSNDTIDAQLIADNIHVHPAGMKILARCKGVERTVLITDAIQATGLGPGQYELGGQPVTVKNGECRLADGTLAGSILTMEQALINFMAATGLTLAEAWPATSRTPARTLGLVHELGSLAPGYRADLVVLDEQLQVVATVVGGEVVYAREALPRIGETAPTPAKC